MPPSGAARPNSVLPPQSRVARSFTMRRALLEEPVSTAALLARQLAFLAAAIGVIATILSRLGRIDPPTAIAVLTVMATVAGLAIIVALIGAIRIWQEGFRGVNHAAMAVFVAALVLGPIGLHVARALTLPAQTDASSDPVQPPSFSRSRAALDARGGLRNQPDGTDELEKPVRVAGRAPIILERPTSEALDIAREAATALGWRVVETIAPGRRTGVGQIDAVAYTPIMRFPDDIAIRVRPLANATRIDIRSASRFRASVFGRHDFGTNARRVAMFGAMVDAINRAR